MVVFYLLILNILLLQDARIVMVILIGEIMSLVIIQVEEIIKGIESLVCARGKCDRKV